jgi:hypothetical protein
MPHVWLPLPSEQALYQGLSTDHYPWTEVYTDLSLRPQFSGVLDVRQQLAGRPPMLGRFVWVGGEVRGGHDLNTDLDIRLLPSTFTRAQVSLFELGEGLAQLLWLCRDGDRTELPLAWPDARDLLAARRFRGALLGSGGQGAQACSYWDAGRVLGGTLPQPGEALYTVAPPARHTHADLEQFWSEVLRGANSRLPLQEAWRVSATRLADEHPCLDPFAREVWIDAQGLHTDPDLPISELMAAMQDQFRAMLALYGVALRSLPMTEARVHPLWPSSGLEE